MRKLFFIFSIFIFIISCKTKPKNIVDVSGIEIEFTIDRFDVDFYSTNVELLNETKIKYPLFFPVNTPDSIWVAKIKDKDEQELFSATQKIFHDLDFLEKELLNLFKHVKFYFPSFIAPKVVTLLTNLDYDNRVLYTNDYLLISLDLYLGEKHEFYIDYPSYIKQNLNKDQIIVDVAMEIIKAQMKKSNNRRFVDKMIYEGKKLFLLDAFLPLKQEHQKIGYSIEKNSWAVENEEEIWKYFIENKILFSSETELNKRFLEVAPFSKFYSSEDNLSPGRIGAWIGWKIVNSFMNNNDISLQELVVLNEEEIYNKSKYKPKK